MLAGVSSARERSPTSEDTACYSGRMDQVEQVVARDSRIAYTLVFGSTARGTATPDSDVDVAIGLQPGAAYSARDVGALIADLEHATGRRVDLVVADEAPPAVAYRIFRDGVPVFVPRPPTLRRREDEGDSRLPRLPSYRAGRGPRRAGRRRSWLIEAVLSARGSPPFAMPSSAYARCVRQPSKRFSPTGRRARS